MPAEGLGKQHPFRVTETEFGVPAELVGLFPRDQAIHVVFPHEHDDVAIEACRGFHLLYIHEEARIARDAQDAPVREHQGCGDSAWQGQIPLSKSHSE